MTKFLVIGLCLAVFLTNPVMSAQAADRVGTKSAISIPLPITVRILDFQTTKKLCGQEIPPTWCPPHLLAASAQIQERALPSTILSRQEKK
mgnify:CR=1 FL=1